MDMPNYCGPDVGPEIVVVGHAASPQPASICVCVLDLNLLVAASTAYRTTADQTEDWSVLR